MEGFQSEKCIEGHTDQVNKHHFSDNYDQKEEVCAHIRTGGEREKDMTEEKERRRKMVEEIDGEGGKRER